MTIQQSAIRLIGTLGLSGALIGGTPAYGQAMAVANHPSDSLLVQVGFERGTGAEGYAAQDVSASLSQIDRLFARLSADMDSTLAWWLDIGRSAYQFDDFDYPGTAHLRNETRLAGGLSQTGSLLGGRWMLGAGYGLSFLQVQNSARLTDSDPAFFFLPWQAMHGVTLQESFRVSVGPVGMALDGEWYPFLFAHLADARLAMPSYLTSFRLTPRVTVWGERFSIGYAYEQTLGSGFSRQSGGPFIALSFTGF